MKTLKFNFLYYGRLLKAGFAPFFIKYIAPAWVVFCVFLVLLLIIKTLREGLEIWNV